MFTYPLRRDIVRLEQLKEDLAHYRLAFGQPRQEDMLKVIRQHGEDAMNTASIDLRS